MCGSVVRRSAGENGANLSRICRGMRFHWGASECAESRKWLVGVRRHHDGNIRESSAEPRLFGRSSRIRGVGLGCSGTRVWGRREAVGGGPGLHCRGWEVESDVIIHTGRLLMRCPWSGINGNWTGQMKTLMMELKASAPPLHATNP